MDEAQADELLGKHFTQEELQAMGELMGAKIIAELQPHFDELGRLDAPAFRALEWVSDLHVAMDAMLKGNYSKAVATLEEAAERARGWAKE